MRPKKRLERISMTIAADLIGRADQLARRWDRSRSWVIAEAVRRLAEKPEGSGSKATSESGSKATGGPAVGPVLDPSRRRQLAADLRLSPEARVVEAERTARESPAVGRSFSSLWVSFDRWEDYFEWKHLEAAGLL
jgi:hypothetical protein